MQDAERDAIIRRLESMLGCLTRAAAVLGAEGATRRPAAGHFSLVEHVWHLADLEREGYAVRLRRLREEDRPELPDFDGDRIAAERRYETLWLADGLAAFSRARAETVRLLRDIRPFEWSRPGAQEG